MLPFTVTQNCVALVLVPLENVTSQVLVASGEDASAKDCRWVCFCARAREGRVSTTASNVHFLSIFVLRLGTSELGTTKTRRTFVRPARPSSTCHQISPGAHASGGVSVLYL